MPRAKHNHDATFSLYTHLHRTIKLFLILKELNEVVALLSIMRYTQNAEWTIQCPATLICPVLTESHQHHNTFQLALLLINIMILNNVQCNYS